MTRDLLLIDFSCVLADVIAVLKTTRRTKSFIIHARSHFVAAEADRRATMMSRRRCHLWSDM